MKEIKRLDMKLGFLCNNRCVFCAQGHKRSSFENKPFHKITGILQANSNAYSGVVFTGGEPTLHSDFLKIAKCASEAGYKSIQVQSNGRLFCYKEFCLETQRAGVTEYCLAIHGPNAKIHDRLTKAEGSFQQTLQGIANTRSLKTYVGTNTVITNSNYKFLPQIARILVDLGVDQFQFAFPHIIGTAWENRGWLIPRKSEVIEYVKKGLEVGIKAKKKVMAEAIPYCFMAGYEACVAERLIPETKVIDANFIVKNYTRYRKEKGKAKHDKCKACSYDSVCEGPWREYPELFGWDEFSPR